MGTSLPLELNTATFTCFFDGSWKADEPTSRVGWVVELQDGATDLLGIKGGRRGLSLLHTEMHGLLWAMSSLKGKKIFLFSIGNIFQGIDSYGVKIRGMPKFPSGTK